MEHELHPPSSLKTPTSSAARLGPALLIFLVCSALYWFTRSPALDEWDSVQFALGVDHQFNLFTHQPHPPGYPLYIFSGWLFGRAFGMNASDALHLSSALGGGLFVAAWFAIFIRRFSLAISWSAACAIALLPVTWMTATKVLTDAPATGLLAVQLLAAMICTDRGTRTLPLLATALMGALASGVRPQNTGISALILILALIFGKAHRREWWVGIGAFVLACLAWLLPVVILQSRLPEAGGHWSAYPQQLLTQWRWRLDKPTVSILAKGQTAELLLNRINAHFAGWIVRGFNFSPGRLLGWLGIELLAIGWTLFALAQRRRAALKVNSGAAPFWHFHVIWAGPYTAMIFGTLPADQRYYLPIFPLLVLAAVAGWSSLPRPLGSVAMLIMPIAAWVAVEPLIDRNHKEEPPPLRLIRIVQNRHAESERSHVWLILQSARRHAEYYAPDFHVTAVETFRYSEDPAAFKEATAVYTDDLAFTWRWPAAAGRWEEIAEFHRPAVIYRKHNQATLYRLIRPEKSPAPAVANPEESR